MCMYACAVCVRLGLGKGGGGGVGVREIGVNLLWQDVALLPYESD